MSRRLISPVLLLLLLLLSEVSGVACPLNCGSAGGICQFVQQQLDVEYFSVDTVEETISAFAGPPACTAVFGSPNIIFQQMSPCPAATADFAARLTGYILAPAGGPFNFQVRHDDAYRLYVDNNLILGYWAKGTGTDNSGAVSLTAGVYYPFKLEMVDYAAEAEWIVRWKTTAGSTYNVIPSTSMYQARCNCPLPWGGASCGSQLGCLAENSDNAQFPGAFSETTVSGTCLPGFFSAGPLRTCTGTTWGPVINPCLGSPPSSSVSYPQSCVNGGTCYWTSGLKMDYYAETSITTLTSFILSTTTPNINFDWGSSQPFYGITWDFSAQFTGFLKPEASGNYLFKADIDDAVRLWIDNVLVIDSWACCNGESKTAANRITLAAGVYHPFRLDYQDNGSTARCKLFWDLDSVENLVASEYFFQSACACPAPWTGTTCSTQGGCHGETSGNAVWPSTFSENNVVGTCLPNYYSSNPQRYCQGNTWGSPVVPCTQVYCQLDSQQSGPWPQTAAGTSATITCAAGFYSPGVPTRPCTQGSGSVGSWGTVTNPCVSCGCGAGSASSSCNSAGECLCNPGFTGAKCDQCLPNFYGSTCQACPNCQNGTCVDGLAGNGSCSCSQGWAKSSSLGCDICSAGRFGLSCSGLCPDCNGGICLDGVAGSGSCACPTGWANNGSAYCSVCADGYVMSEGNCVSCDITCQTCDGTLPTNCLTCPTNTNFIPSNHSCSSGCGQQEYSDEGVCTECDASCKTCISAGPNSCTSCSDDLVFDAGTCSSACQTPRTFNSSGVCSPCSLRCQTCEGASANSCSSCVPGFLLDVDGSCVVSCQQPNYYAGNDGVCHECHPNCSTCAGPGPAQCLTCPPSTSLNGGSCLESCPQGKFSGTNRVCQACFATCLTCTGPGFSDCSSCNSASAVPYFDGGLCLNRCNSFRYAPADTFVCQDCECNGHATSCSDEGVCADCTGNTHGMNCHLCLPNAFRLDSDPTSECGLCDCNGLSGTCNSTTGSCTTCMGNTMGAHCEECKPGFVQYIPGVGCSIVNCPSETADGTTWPATLLGTTATGTCALGYHASGQPPKRNCTNSGITAVWDPVVTNPCEVTMCRFVNESGTLWPTTPAGVTVTGECSNKVPEVPPTRICLQSSGSRGVWGPISNPCEVADDFTQSPFVKIGIPVLVAGLVLLVLVGLGILLYINRAKKRRNETKIAAYMLAEAESNIQLADFEAFVGATGASPTQTSKSSSGNTTMLNTIINGQISLPGFLIMSYGKDIRAEKMIASGGGGKISFGVIVNSDLRAKYPMYSDSVAIKSVEAGEGISEADSTASFHQEVAVLNALSYHPNIAKLLGYTENPNCIITPLYQGDLNSLIHVKEVHKYTSLDAMDLAAQMMVAVDAVHSIMVAHRDIKPSNFLLDPRPVRPGSNFGEWSSFPFKVRLCDFGICYIDSDQAKPILQVYNQFGFSARYAAPEVFSKLIQPSSNAGLLEYQMAEMYSMGICIWELIHRQIPWPVETFEQIQHRVIGEERPPVTLENDPDPKIAFLAQLAVMCWHQSPINRPAFRNLVALIRNFMAKQETPYTETPLGI